MPVSATPAAEVKPLVAETDLFGMTHPGRVRASNADHFLIASFHRAMKIHASSSPRDSFTTFSPDSRGVMGMVADGVGSLAHGEDGSAQATDAAARFLLDMQEISLQADPEREAEVVEKLRALANAAHAKLRAFAQEIGAPAATTITMLIAIWPRVFVVHAGDSRCYRLRDGVLEQLTTDQTMAQAMIDAGAMSREAADASRFKHVLLSALGSAQFEMQVVSLDLRRSDRFLLCSDGLTNHVTDDEIREKLGSEIGSRAVCQQLLDLALERGGTDNITVVASRARDLPA